MNGHSLGLLEYTHVYTHVKHASKRAAPARCIVTRRTAGLGLSGAEDRRLQTRNKVLDAALRLFDQHGYLGVRVEDIAAEAGVSRATFYKHFAEREQVLAELFERLLGAEEDLAPKPPEDTSQTAEQQIVELVEAAVRRMLEQERLAKFVYSLPVRHSALLRAGARTTPPVFQQVTRLLESAVERGAVRDDLPVALMARHVLDALETGMRDWAEDRVEDPPGHVRLMLELAFHGLSA